MSKRYGIYLSSTLQDLQAERTAVMDLLTQQAFSVKQSYSASESDLIASCLDDVAQCSVYIGIVGQRYGYTPANGNGKSITELEYEQARKHNIPCYVFVKDDKARTYQPSDLDSHTQENGAGAAIAKFRQRIQSGAEVRPGNFSTLEDIKLAVAAKMADFRRNVEGTAPLLHAQSRNVAELTHDIALVMVPGTDDDIYKRLQPLCTDSRFKIVQPSPAEPTHAAIVDTETRTCRAACWVLSKASIARLKATPQLLTAIVEIYRFRFGATFALLVDGASVSDLDPGWSFDYTVAPPSAKCDAEILEQCYVTIRANAPQIHPDRRISIPVMVLALTEAEAQSLLANAEQVMSAFATKNERAMRRQQYEEMYKAITSRIPLWPTGFYGATRESWRPFGPSQPDAEALLDRALRRINDDAQRSSRERLLLAGENVKLHLRRYRFEEYLNDRYGSCANLDRIRDLGCLLLVDEMALLHPALRERAHDFLSGQRVAVMSANPCDPAAVPVSELLDDLSFLRVGVVRERFRVAHDPRCELAINSVERMERWLRLILPELVPALGQLEPQQDLRNKSDELFTAA